MQNKEEICVLGMFRSGTNYTKALLELNLECIVKFDSFGWKHAFFPIISENSNIKYPQQKIVAVTRNPYLSLVSLFDYARRNGKNLSCATENLQDFLSSPIVIFDSWQARSPKYFFSSPIEYWQSMTYNLVSVCENNESAVAMKYEELVADPAGNVQKIKEKLKLKMNAGEFVAVEKRMKNLGSNQHSVESFFQNIDFDKQRVDPKNYMQRFSGAERQILRSKISREALEYSGYLDCFDSLSEM